MSKLASIDDVNNSKKKNDFINNGEIKLKNTFYESIFHSVEKLEKIKKIKERYFIGNLLGSGSSGKVYKATHYQLQIECAIKFIRKDTIKESFRKS